MKDYSFFMEGTNGKGVLLIHGLTGIPGEMRPVGKLLNRKGYTVYAPLLAGHGDTEKALLKTSWQDWYESVKKGFFELKGKTDQTFTAGICAGGALGLYLAAEHPKDVSGTAIYSHTFRYDGWNMPKFYVAAPLIPIAAYIPLLRNLKFKEQHPFGIKDDRIRNAIIGKSGGKDFMEGVLDYFPLRALDQMYRLGGAINKIAPKVTTPTLLIHAKNDDLSHPRNSRYLARRLGKNCRMELLEDSYHMVHIDRERSKVAEMTADFFNSVI